MGVRVRGKGGGGCTYSQQLVTNPLSFTPDEPITTHKAVMTDEESKRHRFSAIRDNGHGTEPLGKMATFV